jgi:phosphoribosylaminoimidazole-succinocarboxamide synthase
MARRKKVYEGKAKILYEGPEPGTLVQYFKDDATAFNAEKARHDRRQGRAEQPPERVLHEGAEPDRRSDPFHPPHQHARAADPRGGDHPAGSRGAQRGGGSISKRLGIEEGTPLPRPIVEFYFKNDELGDPLVAEEHILAFGWATQQDLDDMVSLALRVNDFLSGLFLGVGIKLVDFKIEIGRIWDGDYMRLIVADEISPDSCRLWDIETGRSSTRTCSAAIWAIWPMPTRRSRGGWA